MPKTTKKKQIKKKTGATATKKKQIKSKSKVSQAKAVDTVTFNLSTTKGILNKIDINAKKMGLSRSAFVRHKLQAVL